VRATGGSRRSSGRLDTARGEHGAIKHPGGRWCGRRVRHHERQWRLGPARHGARKNEEFFLKSAQGELEFTLLAEGIRKLGLLWVLIQNGTLLDGTVLLWDEPETNLNPRLMQTVVQILIELQRMGVQIFVTTHNYTVLKEFDLQLQSEDKALFHSLFRDEERNVVAASFARYEQLQPNAIDDTLGDLADREIRRQMGNLGR
jgi:hypothetical protein